MEVKLKETAPRGKKKEAAGVLEPMVERISSGTVLVPVADKRPPAKTIAAQDFPALGSDYAIRGGAAMGAAHNKMMIEEILR
jgi:hypothetical protein